MDTAEEYNDLDLGFDLELEPDPDEPEKINPYDQDFPYPIYAIQEKNPNKKHITRIVITEAKELNEKGYGIFWSINMLNEAEKRQVANLDNVLCRYNFIDLDSDNKNLDWIKILESPLVPSMVIETRSGFHVYWKNKDLGKDVAQFREIQKRLIEFFESDPMCKDALRLLRVPSFKQWKHCHKGEDPFVVERIFKTEIAYDTEDFLSTFFPSKDQVKVNVVSDRDSFLRHRDSTSKRWDISWETLINMDQKELLIRLSGKSYVNGENYTFLKNSNGTEQIVVNGISTSCFIRGNEIVADTGYGNNIYNWLRWGEYNNSDREIIEILRDVVPEMFDVNRSKSDVQV